MKTLILIRGLPGSGKTSFAEFLLDLPQDATCYAADDWMEEGDQYSWDRHKLEECHQACIQACEFDMATSSSVVIVHNTMSTEAEVEPYLKLAEKYGYQVISLVLENRHGSPSVHDVPQKTIEKMRQRFSIKL